ncbi:MAG: enoyl-CoA hydratase/isomerase family protein [Alphaproteobacteria bacterium]|nr:enoyl-CoA hydratase/isomerase family protein [Alphaproteobacteria bacterium]
MSYNEFETLRVKLEQGVAFVTIDNPPINLLDRRLRADLEAFARAVAADERVRVIVFDSADPEFFIAHTDATPFLQRLSDPPPPRADRLGEGYAMRELFYALPQPTIAKVEGRCRGGGCEFVLALDMRFAALGRAVFCQFEVAVGCVPGGGATQRLPRLIGRGRALEMLLGCDDIDAEGAELYGLVNRALPAETIGPFVERLALRIAAFPAEAVRLARQAVRASEAGLHAGLLEEQFWAGQALASAGAGERLPRFFAMGAQTREVELDLPQALDLLGGKR